jgi:CPA1 family monovalent cation:H+ antiporter
MGHTGELFLGLMVAIAVLSLIARWLGQPYPILLVVGGLAIGLVPGLPDVRLNPDLVLLLFLPPLLYAAAFFASLRDLRNALRPIVLLAVGLVIATTCAVAVVAHALIPGLPWAAAFVLGAVVAPTDPTAATEIAHSLGVPRSTVTLIEGESLINDGTALTLYKVAIAATVGGGFSAVHTAGSFFLDAAGGIAIGLAVGWVVAEVRKRLDDPQVAITISLATGYAAYLPAEQLGLSGVLATVSAAIYMSWNAPAISTPQLRMQSSAVWENLVFLLNASLFVLIGLQLRVVLDGLHSQSAGELIGYAAAVCATVLFVRLLWGQTVVYVVRLLSPRLRRGQGRTRWQSRFIVGWMGMRGAVSLAAALAIPLHTNSGAPFPGRDLIVFLAFSVIVFTLVGQGLTLPLLIRKLGVEEDDGAEREEVYARRAAADAALVRLDELEGEDWTRNETVERVRGLYEYRRRRFQARFDGDGSDGIEERSSAYQRLMRELYDAQRDELIRLRRLGKISDDVMRAVERDIDLEDTRLEI